MCIVCIISALDTQVKMASYIPRVFLPGSDHYACHMAQARKKSTPATPAPKKPRLSQAEATARMLNATIQLLVERAPGEVTVARICEKAGVHTDYVVRYFGSREELLSQAVETAFFGFFVNTNSDEATRLNLVLEGNIDVLRLAKARMQTITYLLGCGVSPERFQANQKLVLESVFAQSTSNTQVGDALAKERIEKIREAASKLASADNKDFWGSVLSIAGKALLAIGAVVATVASAGSLGPVLLPLAVYSIMGSVSGLINDVLKQMGHPDGMGFDLTVGNLVKVIAEKVFDVDEETAKGYMKWTDIAVGVAIAVVSVGAMFKSGAALLKAGDAAAGVGAAKLGSMANKLNAVTQMAGSAATMASARPSPSTASSTRSSRKTTFSRSSAEPRRDW